MTIWTLVSRITGFMRTWAMAVALGVTFGSAIIPIASSYNIANNIPNMIFELVAGGVLSSMFIPILTEKLQREGDEAARRFANTLFGITALALGIVAVAGTFWPGPFVLTQTFRISRSEATLATHLFRFFAVQVVFYGWIALSTGVLNTYRRFVAPAFAPVLNNLVVTAVLLGAYLPLRTSDPDLAITALGIGTTLGVVSMFLATVPSLLSTGFRFRLALDLRDPTLRKMGLKMLPVLGYVGVNLVGVSFRNAFATEAFRDGSATLAYAWMWYQLPYGVLAVSLITALFPELSSLANQEAWGGFRATLAKGLRAMSVLVMPTAAMLVALAGPLASLYRFGRFPEKAVPLVASVLTVWALGLFSFATFMLALRAFYAMQDSLTPMLTNLGAHGVQILLYWLLTTQVLSGSAALLGIPIADGVAFTINLVALVWLLRRRIGPFDGRAIAATWGKSLVAAVLGGVAAWAVARLTDPWAANRAVEFVRVLVCGSAGLSVSFGMLSLMRVDEVRYATDVVARMVRRFLPEPRTDEP